MKNLKIILTTLFVIILVLCLMVLIAFSSRFTKFYKDCVSIKEGWSKVEVTHILSRYLQDKENYIYSYEEKNGIQSINISKQNNDQCEVFFEGEFVKKVELYFEP